MLLPAIPASIRSAEMSQKPLRNPVLSPFIVTKRAIKGGERTAVYLNQRKKEFLSLSARILVDVMKEKPAPRLVADVSYSRMNWELHDGGSAFRNRGTHYTGRSPNPHINTSIIHVWERKEKQREGHINHDFSWTPPSI